MRFPFAFVFAFALFACSANEPVPSPAPAEKTRTAFEHVTITERQLAFSDHDPVELETPSIATLAALRPTPERIAALRSRRHQAWSQPSNVRKLLRPIENAGFVMERGQTMVDLIASLPEPRRSLGVTGLPVQVMVANCEQAHVEFSVEHEGQTYDAVYEAASYLNTTALAPSLYALSSTCAAALLASGGAIQNAVGAGCTRDDQNAHFPAGFPCAVCLGFDGDLERCINNSSCPREQNREIEAMVGNELRSLDVLEMTSLACAPNLTAPMFALVDEIGVNNTVPPAYDSETYHHICTWHWNPGLGEPRPFCRGAEGPINPTMLDQFNGGVVEITRRSDGFKAHQSRVFMAASAELDGLVFEGFVLVDSAFSSLSHRDHSEGGWGFNPQDLRADGTDPNNVNHTRAREWISLYALKTVTTRNGVPIAIINKNLCSDDQWRGPDAEGRYYCKQPGWDATNPPPDEDNWAYDWGSFNGPGEGQIRLFPIVTLASTGLMDQSSPGGHLPHILGSGTLANPAWDNCAWRDQFVPDEMANFDTPTPEGFHYTQTTQTYRFGKNSGLDIRLVLATNQRRGFCAPHFPDL